MVTATVSLINGLRARGLPSETHRVLTKAEVNAVVGIAVSAYSSIPDMDAQFSSADIDSILDLAEESRKVLVRVAEGGIVDAVHVLNGFFRGRPLILRITPSAPWMLHHHMQGNSIADHWRIGSMVAIANLLSTGSWNRIGVCQAEDCRNIFVDATKNMSRRYCSSRCLRRMKVREYRRRRLLLIERNDRKGGKGISLANSGTTIFSVG
mgnify:CR=1 FL=1